MNDSPLRHKSTAGNLEIIPSEIPPSEFLLSCAMASLGLEKGGKVKTIPRDPGGTGALMN